MRVMMFVVMLAVMLGANFYVLYRVWQMIPAGSVLRPAWAVFVGVAVAAFFLSLLLSGKLSTGFTAALYRVGTSWFFIMFYLLMIFLLLDLVRVTRLLPVSQYMFGSWTGLGVLAALIAVIFTAGYITYQHKKRVELNIEVPGSEWEKPIKIVAASDLHLGYNVGKKEFSRWVEMINAENPDVVVLAGDVIDNTIRPLLEQDMAAALKEIKATYGVFVAPGNHEYISGIAHSVAFLESSGATVLRDSAVLVGGRLYIAGRDDRSNPRRKTVAGLLEPLDRSKPVVLLDHQPYHLEEAEANNVLLQFSGHTHRGQVWPINWITDAMYEVSYGYKRKGNSHFYVSSGLGLWGGKFRIGSRSEYVVIQMK